MNLEEIWKWLKGKRNTFFAEAATAFILIAVLGVAGINSYPDVRTGVRAQIQHLKAYATADPLAQECVDDRYEYVQKGSAPYVQWLGQKENPQGAGWATAENYGYSIVEMISHLKGKNS